MELLYKLIKKNNRHKHASSFNERVELQTQSTIDMESLYRSLFELEEWIFLSNQWDDVDTASPLIVTLENRKWVYVFTDATTVMNFVKATPEYTTPNGSVLVIKIVVERALKLMGELSNQGIYGIRVNDGSMGWNFPIAELDAILFHLDKTNVL